MPVFVTVLVGIALVATLFGLKLKRSLILKRVLISLGAGLVVMGCLGAIRMSSAMARIQDVPGMPEVAKPAGEYTETVLLSEVCMGVLGILFVGAGIFDRQVFPRRQGHSRIAGELGSHADPPDQLRSGVASRTSDMLGKTGGQGHPPALGIAPTAPSLAPAVPPCAPPAHVRILAV
jgi:hypothetical protein